MSICWGCRFPSLLFGLLLSFSLNIFPISFSKLKWLAPNNPSGNCWSLAIYLLMHSFKHNQDNLTLIAIHFLSYFTFCIICLYNKAWSPFYSTSAIRMTIPSNSFCKSNYLTWPLSLKPRVFNMTIDPTAFDCLLFFSFPNSFNSSLWESRIHHFSVETTRLQISSKTMFSEERKIKTKYLTKRKKEK